MNLKYLIVSLLFLFITSVNAQTIPAYSGCILTWELPQPELTQSIGIHVEGREGSIPLGATITSYECDKIATEFGVQTWKIRTWNKTLGHSPFAEVVVDYQPKPIMLAPTRAKITLEWEVIQ